MARLTRSFFARGAEELAAHLLGQRLVRILPGGERLAGIILETEAYLGVKDRAAHTFGGRRTTRNEAMYAAPGTAYVYFTYGMHYCMNIVCGKLDEPVAVLVRALEPVEGLEEMARLRGATARKAELAPTSLCSGPAKLCQALGIDKADNMIDMVESDALWLERGRRVPTASILRGARIGIRECGEWEKAPLRFWVKGNPHVSR